MLSEATARVELERFLAAVPAPVGPFEGAGIVIPAGGERYLPPAWVCIRRLRELGCTLPIQLWHLGRAEMSPTMRELLAGQQVTTVDARELRAIHPARTLNGYEVKAYALLHSPFRDVLLLDADNVPLVDPTFLFETAAYRQLGALFWPDYGRFAPNRSVWALTGVAYNDEPEFESGQICVDRLRHADALALAMWMNEHSDFWYQHILGDKDTFHLAFRKLDRPYAMLGEAPVNLANQVMCQRDPDGRVIFQHRNLDKWRIAGDNPVIPGFADDPPCRRYLEELRISWPRIAEELDARRLEEVMLSKRWLYERIHHDVRPIAFLSDGVIGEGAARCEVRWRIERRELRLIADDGLVTCSLRFDPVRGSWHGRWHHFERMEVAIRPI